MSKQPHAGGPTPELEHDAARLALERSEARWKALLSSMLDPMLAIDAHGIVVAASDSVLRVFGYRPDELVGRNVKMLMPEPHGSAHDGYLERYRRTGVTGIIGATRQFDVVRKDGAHLVVELSVGRADGPDGPVFTGTFRDVTARLGAEEALRDSERRFHAIFDHAFQYLGLLAPDGTLLEANQTALDATGVRREEVIGKPFWETRWWVDDPDSRERIEAAVRAAAAGEFVRFEIEQLGIGGARVEVDFSLKPVRDEAGRVVLLIPEGRNISEIKRAQRAETAMLRALATIGESAAVLAHEIKNPITAVNVALRAVADQLGEDHQEILEDLVSRMQRLEVLMRRTLSFARPLDVRREVIDAHELFRTTVADLRSELVRTGSDVSIAIEPGAVSLSGDPHLLEEVLTNLIRNAVEAKSDGARVVLSAVRIDAGVGLSVEDDGPGIPESMREMMFKPFTTSKRKGNGLGLAICKKIVEEHGGTISVQPRRGCGARFELRLPDVG